MNRNINFAGGAAVCEYKDIAPSRPAERRKTAIAAIAAVTVGLAGAVFMGCAVLAYLGGMYILSLVLSVPGFVGLIIPYSLYGRIRGDESARPVSHAVREYNAGGNPVAFRAVEYQDSPMAAEKSA